MIKLNVNNALNICLIAILVIIKMNANHAKKTTTLILLIQSAMYVLYIFKGVLHVLTIKVAQNVKRDFI